MQVQSGQSRADGPVASVAIRRVTGGCEAYTVRKQAVRIQLRNLFFVAMPTPLAWRKAAFGRPQCEVVPESPESLARGMLSKGSPANPGELSTPAAHGLGAAQSKATRSPGERGSPAGSEIDPRRAEIYRQGRPEAVAKGTRAVLQAHGTNEGGEPQGSRKGRPRNPLEGRGAQVDVSRQFHLFGTQNSEN